LYLLYKNKLAKPCFYISHEFEKDRLAYNQSLQNIRDKNDLINWIKFFLKAAIGTAQSAKEKFKRAVHQVELYEEYISEKRASNSIRKIIFAMIEYPVANINRICRITGLSKQTATNCMRTLLKDGIVITSKTKKRNKYYILHEYFNVFD